MTVAELIERLQMFPQHLPVKHWVPYTSEADYLEIEDVLICLHEEASVEVE